MTIIEYTKGWHEVARDTYAYLQPRGQWGYSNAGFVVSDEQCLLVDTLFSLDLTEQMLSSLRADILGQRSIDFLVNTHNNGDHCYGNQLVTGATIISSSATAIDVAHDDPELLKGTLESASQLGSLGAYFQHCFGDFDFSGITVTAPTSTFTGELVVAVGTREVRLIELGPAHTVGDIVAFVPDVATLFAGDLLFVDGTPILWAGPFSNWIRACNVMVGLQPHRVVPGHGPVTDVKGIGRVRDYLEYVYSESLFRYEAGVEPFDAALDIDLGIFVTWNDNERLALNVAMAYHEFDPQRFGTPGALEAFTIMANYREAKS